MLTKPFIFLLTFILTVINFVILLVPLSILVFPLFIVFSDLFTQVGMDMVYFTISRISMLIIAYIALDSLFGITLWKVSRGCIPFKKATYIQGHEEIHEAFELLKKRFRVKSVELYLSSGNSQVNAFAVGGFFKGRVIITSGLIERIHDQTIDHNEYINAVKAVLGHEMSHLANKDFLPGLLASASDSANRLMTRVVRWVFVILSKFFHLVPFVGYQFAWLLIRLYNIVNSVINSFYRFIFMPLYRFLSNYFSRSIEYRCDRDAAKVFGGPAMASAMAAIGGGGYFSLFSTHPTSKSRINRVKDIRPADRYIRPNILGSLANLISVALVVMVCVYSTQMASVPDIQEAYMREVHYPVMNMVAKISDMVNYMQVHFQQFFGR